MADQERRYKIAYRLEYNLDGMTKEELLEKNLGGCDAIVVISVVRPSDGSLSTVIASLDGNTSEEMPGDELFKAWIMMAKKLSESKTLGPNKKLFATQTFETIREIIMSKKEG